MLELFNKNGCVHQLIQMTELPISKKKAKARAVRELCCGVNKTLGPKSLF
jgi:hypothetical protein